MSLPFYLWLLLALAATCTSAPPQEKAGNQAREAILMQAKQAEAADDLSRAASLYTSYLAEYPDDPEVLERLGLIYYLGNRFDAAAPVLERALTLDYKRWGSALFLGVCDYRMGQFENGLRPLQRALQIKPDLAEAHFWLGSTLLALNRVEDAILELEKVSANSPDRVQAEYLLVKAFRDAADLYYRRIERSDTDSARAHQLEAEALVWRNHPGDAITEYGRALARQPELQGVHNAVGDLYWQQGKYDQAAEEYQAELKVNALDFESQLRLGEYWLAKGDSERAISHLEVAARADKNSTEASHYLGEAALALNDLRRAETALGRAIQLQPSDPSNHKLLAEVYRRQGKSELAQQETETTERLSRERLTPIPTNRPVEQH